MLNNLNEYYNTELFYELVSDLIDDYNESSYFDYLDYITDLKNEYLEFKQEQLLEFQSECLSWFPPSKLKGCLHNEGSRLTH